MAPKAPVVAAEQGVAQPSAAVPEPGVTPPTGVAPVDEAGGAPPATAVPPEEETAEPAAEPGVGVEPERQEGEEEEEEEGEEGEAGLDPLFCHESEEEDDEEAGDPVVDPGEECEEEEAEDPLALRAVVAARGRGRRSGLGRKGGRGRGGRGRHSPSRIKRDRRASVMARFRRGAGRSRGGQSFSYLELEVGAYATKVKLLFADRHEVEDSDWWRRVTVSLICLFASIPNGLFN